MGSRILTTTVLDCLRARPEDKVSFRITSKMGLMGHYIIARLGHLWVNRTPSLKDYPF